MGLSRIMFVVCTAMAWVYWVFYQFRKVSSSSLTWFVYFNKNVSLLAEINEQDSAEFRRFRRQLFHSSLTKILTPLKTWMTRPRITRCADGHFRWVIYGLGPYIADYPEQCLLACVLSGWCPKYVLFNLTVRLQIYIILTLFKVYNVGL